MEEKVNMEISVKVVLTIFGVIVFIFFLKGVWKGQLDIKETWSRASRKLIPGTDIIAKREPNKIYQNGREVGIVSGNVQEKNDTIIFEELSETEELNKTIPFEYQRHKIKITRINAIAGVQIAASNTNTKMKKAVLSNVVCEKIR